MTPLKTPWFDSPDIGEAYPRPQCQRSSYLSLNGQWDLTIESPAGTKSTTIRVPFSPESLLSGVHQPINVDDRLIYQREVRLPEGFHQGRLILHFDAVDQEADVFVNRRLAIHHLGGFTPFEVDITAFVTQESFLLQVFVKDITDTADRQTGKQRLLPGGIWYTPQSGIWQTVWLESVPSEYVKRLVLTPLYHKNGLRVQLETNCSSQVLIHAEVWFDDRNQGVIDTTDKTFEIALTERHLWTPETPHLYQVKIHYGEDIIDSYFGMRLFERKADAKGIQRFYLNEQPYFLTGVLDQGYYPDGLLTPPSDAAMIEDIAAMKRLGLQSPSQAHQD
jgi:beta-galactosidase/beta-glucuronidase